MSMFMLFGRKRWSMVSVNAFSRPNWEGEDVLVKRTTMTVHRGLVHLRMTTLLALLPSILTEWFVRRGGRPSLTLPASFIFDVHRNDVTAPASLSATATPRAENASSFTAARRRTLQSAQRGERLMKWKTYSLRHFAILNGRRLRARG